MHKIEMVTLVDEQDRVIGKAEKLAAHEKAQCHRAFSVFILRKKADETEVLIHQRHPDKYHCGGLWTNTCCGHPRPEEAAKTGAERRLMEEMGIQTNLHFIDKFHYIAKFENGLTENEVDHVFYNVIAEQHFTVNKNEVAAFKWLSFASLKQAMANNPQHFTPWLDTALKLLLNHLTKEDI